MWREWIEILEFRKKKCFPRVSPSVWREWIEMVQQGNEELQNASPSVWREWIEIWLCLL